MKRLGTVIEFKPGLTREQIVAALEKIRDVLSLPAVSHHYPPDGTVLIDGHPVKKVKHVVKQFVLNDMIHDWDDEVGHPAWYIP